MFLNYLYAIMQINIRHNIAILLRRLFIYTLYFTFWFLLLELIMKYTGNSSTKRYLRIYKYIDFVSRLDFQYISQSYQKTKTAISIAGSITSANYLSYEQRIEWLRHVITLTDLYSALRR
jgi:hypothetical protein